MFDTQKFEQALQHVYPYIRAVHDNPPPTITLHTFEVVGSTNRTLWQMLEQGAGEGTAAIALRQESGRGQWGRHWDSPPGGLYLSVALTPNASIEASPQLTLCSAWGIAVALRDLGIPVGLKWLNDLVVEKRKLGGILTETKIQQERISQAVVGVGINWANPVPLTGINLQEILSQQSSPAIATLEELAAVVLLGVMSGYRRWQTDGIDAILPGYQALLTSLGCPVTVGDRSGRVTGVAPTGELRVELQTGENSALPTEVCLSPGTISLGYG